MTEIAPASLHEALKREVEALDAAMLLALAEPEKGPVHKLRTATRRLEAQLILLDLVNGKPASIDGTGTNRRSADGPSEIAKVRRRLRRVRQAAGDVRDLDVQRDLIAADAPSKAEVHKGSLGDDLRKEARQLRQQLKKQRVSQVQRLLETLSDEEQKLASALRAMDKAIKGAAAPRAARKSTGRRSAEIRELSPRELLAVIEQWFQTSAMDVLASADKEAPPNGSKPRTGAKTPTPKASAAQRAGEETLHSIRKSAKLCRYMADCVPTPGTEARDAAQRFESIQDLGGRWHDWLLLQHLAEHSLGKQSALAKRYAGHAAAALADYQLRLADLLPRPAAPSPGALPSASLRRSAVKAPRPARPRTGQTISGATR